MLPKQGEPQLSGPDKQKGLDLCSTFHLAFGSRLLMDRRWRDAVVAAATAAGAPRAPTLGGYGGRLGGAASLSLDTMLSTREKVRQRVAVLGFGSTLPALAAAKAGAEVVWGVRHDRLAEIAAAVVRRNGLARRVKVLFARRFEEMGWEGATALDAESKLGGGGRSGRFDAVLTEEFSDDLLADGLLSLARYARAHLLKPRGTFFPKRATTFACLASVRVKQLEGFDVRLFNAFRTSGGAVYDLEECMLNEPGAVSLLLPREHGLLITSATFTYDGGHFSDR